MGYQSNLFARYSDSLPQIDYFFDSDLVSPINRFRELDSLLDELRFGWKWWNEAVRRRLEVLHQTMVILLLAIDRLLRSSMNLMISYHNNNKIAGISIAIMLDPLRWWRSRTIVHTVRSSFIRQIIQVYQSFLIL